MRRPRLASRRRARGARGRGRLGAPCCVRAATSTSRSSIGRASRAACTHASSCRPATTTGRTPLPGRLLPARPARAAHLPTGATAGSTEALAQRRARPSSSCRKARGQRHRPRVPRLGRRSQLADVRSRGVAAVRRRTLPHDPLALGSRDRRPLCRRVRRRDRSASPPRHLLGDRVVVRLLPPDRPDRDEPLDRGPQANVHRLVSALPATSAAPDVPRVLRRPRRPALQAENVAARPRADRREAAASLRRSTRARTRDRPGRAHAAAWLRLALAHLAAPAQPTR